MEHLSFQSTSPAFHPSITGHWEKPDHILSKLLKGTAQFLPGAHPAFLTSGWTRSSPCVSLTGPALHLSHHFGLPPLNFLHFTNVLLALERAKPGHNILECYTEGIILTPALLAAFLHSFSPTSQLPDTVTARASFFPGTNLHLPLLNFVSLVSSLIQPA